MTAYILSLTTTPVRFDNLYITIDSILNQTLVPYKIVINIPRKYTFRSELEIPIDKINDFMDKYSGQNVIINMIDIDYGPGTKLLGLLNSDLVKDFNPETFIIIIDDDHIYKPRMIEYFHDRRLKYKFDVASNYNYNHNGIKVAQGANGFFIKLKYLNNFVKYYDLIKDQDYINYHDDYYISYYFYLINKIIFSMKTPYGCGTYDHHTNADITALSKLDGKYERENLNLKSYEILNELNKNGLFDFLKN